MDDESIPLCKYFKPIGFGVGKCLKNNSIVNVYDECIDIDKCPLNDDGVKDYIEAIEDIKRLQKERIDELKDLMIEKINEFIEEEGLDAEIVKEDDKK